MTGQMHGRVPTTRDRQNIGGDILCSRMMAHAHGCQTCATCGVIDLSPAINREIPRDLRVGSAVDIGADVDTGFGQICCGFERVVIVAKNRNAVAPHNAIAMQIAAHSGCGHNTRTVIIGKGHSALQRARRQNRALCRNAPKTFKWPRFVTRAHVMGHTLHCTKGPLIIGPCHRGTWHQTHIGHRAKLFHHIGGPNGT